MAAAKKAQKAYVGPEQTIEIALAEIREKSPPASRYSFNALLGAQVLATGFAGAIAIYAFATLPEAVAPNSTDWIIALTAAIAAGFLFVWTLVLVFLVFGTRARSPPEDAAKKDAPFKTYFEPYLNKAQLAKFFAGAAFVVAFGVAGLQAYLLSQLFMERDVLARPVGVLMTASFIVLLISSITFTAIASLLEDQRARLKLVQEGSWNKAYLG
jgi:hypothetical protein